MKARKENRLLTIEESEKDFYLAQGYDIVQLDESGKEYEVVEEATAGKTYSANDYKNLKKERDSLEAENQELLLKNEELGKQGKSDREAIKSKLEELKIEFHAKAATTKLIDLLVAYKPVETSGEG